MIIGGNKNSSRQTFISPYLNSFILHSVLQCPVHLSPGKTGGYIPRTARYIPWTYCINLDLCICTVPTIGLYMKLGKEGANSHYISLRKHIVDPSPPRYTPHDATRQPHARPLPPHHFDPRLAAVVVNQPLSIVNIRCHRHHTTMFAVNNITTYRPPVRPPNETRTRVVPHPSQGGNAYAPEVPEVRDQVISVWQNGGDLRSPMLEQLRQERKFPHMVTCNKWIRQFVDEGHTRCKGPTGNHISLREVHGQDLVNLALYRMVRPKK